MKLFVVVWKGVTIPNNLVSGDYEQYGETKEEAVEAAKDLFPSGIPSGFSPVSVLSFETDFPPKNKGSIILFEKEFLLI